MSTLISNTNQFKTNQGSLSLSEPEKSQETNGATNTNSPSKLFNSLQSEGKSKANRSSGSLLESPNAMGSRRVIQNNKKGGRKVMQGQWKKASDLAMDSKPTTPPKKRLNPLINSNLAKASPNRMVNSNAKANGNGDDIRQTGSALKKTVVNKTLKVEQLDSGNDGVVRRRRGVSFMDEVNPMANRKLLGQTQSVEEASTQPKGVLRIASSVEDARDTNESPDSEMANLGTPSVEEDGFGSPVLGRIRASTFSVMSNSKSLDSVTKSGGSGLEYRTPNGTPNGVYKGRRLSGLHKMQRGDEIKELVLGNLETQGSSSRAGRRPPSGNLNSISEMEFRHKELFRANSVRRRSIVTTKNAMFRTPTPNSSRKASISLRAGLLLGKTSEGGIGVINTDVELFEEMYASRQSEFAESVRIADNPFHYLPNASRDSVQRAVDENSKEMKAEDFSSAGFDDWHREMVQRCRKEQLK